MTNENQETPNAEGTTLPIAAGQKIKPKRDILRFNGEKSFAVNLEHVTNISIEGKKITFEFVSTAKYVEMADEAAAQAGFETILKIWVGDIL